MPLTVNVLGLDEIIINLREDSKRLNSLIWQEYFQALRDRTPIRTGRARRGWIAESVNRGDVDDRRIYNKVPYIQYLEAGHSKQAPRGFIRQGQYEGLAKAEAKFIAEQLKLKGK